MSCGHMVAVVLGLALIGCGSSGNSPTTGTDTAASVCDRACLLQIADRYLVALAGRNAASLPLAAKVRYTENGQELALTDGLWATASEVGAYRQVFTDSRGDELGVYASLRENGKQVLLASRMKLVDDRITEIESVLSRPASGVSASIERLEREGSRPWWNETVPENERLTREQLVTAANKYFVALEKNDGKGEYPFTADCYRFENGTLATGNPEMARAADELEKNPRSPSASGGTSGPSTPIAFRLMSLPCKEQFELGYMRMVDRIRDRRFPVVDVERGAVFTLAFFDHSGTVHEVTTTDGKTYPVGLKQPFTWELAEAFKIEQGRIRAIEAVLTQAPYGMKPNWQ